MSGGSCANRSKINRTVFIRSIIPILNSTQNSIMLHVIFRQSHLDFPNQFQAIIPSFPYRHFPLIPSPTYHPILLSFQLTHYLQIKAVFQSIGACLMAVVNGIGAILKAIINGIVSVFDIIISCLTCGRGGGRRRGARSAV